MRCWQCRERQQEYEREELAAGELRELEEHLAHCERCRQYYREVEKLRALLPPLAGVAPERDVWPRLAARIHERQRRAKALPQRVLRPALALATATAAVALVVSMLSEAPRALTAPGGAEFLVENSEAGLVWSDPWAGDVAQALDWVMADKT